MAVKFKKNIEKKGLVCLDQAFSPGCKEAKQRDEAAQERPSPTPCVNTFGRGFSLLFVLEKKKGGVGGILINYVGEDGGCCMGEAA